jgi:ABC-type multidrug transport system fused ATPase/permease subunit
VQEALGSATKVFELVDVSASSSAATANAAISDTAASATAATAPAPRGELELCGVSFRYPTRDGALVLDDVSLAVRPGELVAIVGGSGSGTRAL